MNVPSNTTTKSIADNLAALDGLLRDAVRQSAKAQKLIKRGDRDAAMGVVAGLDAVLAAAIGLYGAAFAFYRLSLPAKGSR